MTNQPPPPPPPPAHRPSAEPEPSFASPGGLRALLDRLHDTGPDAWRTDPEATALLAYTMDRYTPLARSWHRDPGEVGTAAFLAMRHSGVRRAADPWAVVTRAVQVSLSAESHAERHLTSTEKARRSQHAGLIAPIRAGDHTEVLAAETSAAADGGGSGPVSLDAGLLLTLLGWPAPIAEAAVEYVSGRLADTGGIAAAYEALRRDTAIRAQLDLDRTAWAGLLRVLLGANPRPGRPSRRGVLARLLLGETLPDLLDDTALVRAVLASRPPGAGPESRGDACQ